MVFDVYMLYLLSKLYAPIEPYSTSYSTQRYLVYEPTARTHSVALQKTHIAQDVSKNKSTLEQYTKNR
jgi:hypothetical protein